MNVLHFPANYASRVYHNVNALALAGVASRTAIYTSNKYQEGDGLDVYGERYPWLYQKGKAASALLRLMVLQKVLRDLPWCDVVHWYTGSAVFHLPVDMIFVRMFRGKKFVHWQGDDLRDPLLEADRNPWYAMAIKDYCQADLKRQSTRNREKQRMFMDSGFTPLTPVDLEGHLLPEWRDTSIPIRHTVDTHRLVPGKRLQGERIRIAHAPTDSVIKGTKFILPILEDLKRHFPIDVVLLTGMSRKQVVEEIAGCDLFIDNMLQGMYCLASLEAMSLGVPTICNVNEDILARLPPKFPVQCATVDTLKDVIASLIASREIWPDLGRRSREYVVEYHSYETMGRYLRSIYESGAQPL